MDNEARLDERDDAAMDLSQYNSPEVMDALIEIAKNPNMAEILHSSCGESIAEIWARNNQYNQDIINQLCPAAKSELEAFFTERDLELKN